MRSEPNFSNQGKILQNGVPNPAFHNAKYLRLLNTQAQQRTFDTIDELNAKDATIVAEKNFKMVQILQNRSTQITNEPTDEEIAKELFWRLVNNRQWSEEKALEGIKQAYPDVDTAKFLTD